MNGRARDPYARVLALDARSTTTRVVATLAFVGLAVELHVLVKLWVAALTKVSVALDDVRPGWAIVACLGCGVAAFFVPAEGAARRVWNVVGVLGLSLAAATVVAVALLVLVPQMSPSVQRDLLAGTRAVVGGAFAGVVLHAVLSAFGGLSARVRLLASIVFAVAVMVPIGIAGHAHSAERPDEEQIPVEVLLDDPPPPPPPVAEPEEPKPEPEKAVPLPVPTAMPLPSPAQAAKVIAAEPDPNKPLDFTNTIIQGTANDYAGGITSADGQSNTAVRNVAAQNGGVPNATGNAPVAPQVQPARVNRTRPAGLMSHDWRCPFPPEADTAQIDEAVVMLEISVRPDGTPGTVRILSDPGNGFGRMAYQCASRQRFVTALDEDGNPVQGLVRAPVHFNR